MNVLGLDLSMTGTGICSVNGETRTIKPKSSLGDQRLSLIHDEVNKELSGVDVVVIEDLPTHAHGAGVTGMVHGAVRHLLLLKGIDYVLVTPATLKKFATGKGNADKTAMTLAAYKRSGLEFDDDNQVDAFWLRVAGLTHYGSPPFPLPAVQVECLEKVNWV